MAIQDAIALYKGNKDSIKQADLQDIVDNRQSLTFNLDSRFVVVAETFVHPDFIAGNVHIATVDGGDVGLTPGMTYYILPKLATLRHLFPPDQLTVIDVPTITQEGQVFAAYIDDISTSPVVGYGLTAEDAEKDFAIKTKRD